jgi:hypothetical protein
MLLSKTFCSANKVNQGRSTGLDEGKSLCSRQLEENVAKVCPKPFAWKFKQQLK